MSWCRKHKRSIIGFAAVGSLGLLAVTAAVLGLADKLNGALAHGTPAGMQ